MVWTLILSVVAYDVSDTTCLAYTFVFFRLIDFRKVYIIFRPPVFEEVCLSLNVVLGIPCLPFVS